MSGFDDRDGFIWKDGKFVDWRDANVHVLNHGLHYASAVFEGTRMYNGKIFKNNEHSTRLKKSAEIMDMTLPYSSEEINQLCLDICKKNSLHDAYLRPIVWRGSEKMQITAKENTIHFAIAAWQWPNLYGDLKRQGVHMKVSRFRRMPSVCGPVFAKASGLYMICTIAKHEAEREGFNDSLMLDCDDNIAEGTGANFFAIFDGEIHTPNPDCFLNGITRRTVMDLARNLGYKVVERKIATHELANMQDAFVTGTAAEVTRVASITTQDGSTRYEFKDAKVSLHLLDSYRDLVNS